MKKGDFSKKGHPLVFVFEVGYAKTMPLNVLM